MSRLSQPLTHSGAVTLAACLLLVLLALYLLKERRRRVRVPNVRFLEVALNKALQTRMASKWRRLRSFLLQLLCLGLALLALTDPWVHAPNEGDDDRASPKTHDRLVLILDRSRSMSTVAKDAVRCAQGSRESITWSRAQPGCFIGPVASPATIFDVARAEAYRQIALSPKGTRILLATLDKEVTTHLVWGGRDEAAKILDGLRPVDLGDAISPLEDWLQIGWPLYRQAKVVAISDLQSEEWAKLTKSVPIELVGTGYQAGNLVIEDFRVRAKISTPGSARVLCRLRYLAPKGPESLQFKGARPVQLEISARTTDSGARHDVVEVRSLSLTPGQSEVLEFDVADLPGAILRARVWPIVSKTESRERFDANRRDSVRWAHVPALKQVRVALIGEPPVSLVAALTSDPFVQVLEPLGAPNLDAADVIIATGIAPDEIEKPTLILNPPVGQGRWEANGSLNEPKLRIRKHRFWKDLHPGTLALESAVWFTPGSGDQVILTAKKKAIGVLSLEGSVPVLQLGLDPSEPAWVYDLTYPAVLARSVDLLYDRVEETGREALAGFVSLLDWSDHPGLGIRSLDTTLESRDDLGTTVWLPDAGVYLLSSRGATLRPIVVAFLADDAEDRIEPQSEQTERSSWRERPPARRSALWLGALLLVLFLVLVDRWLFVSRRVV